MRAARLVLIPILMFALLVSALPAGTWKWQTHGGTPGNYGIAAVAYSTIGEDSSELASQVDWRKYFLGEMPSTKLKWELVMAGSIAPDKWRQEPYFLDEPELGAPSKHVMTKVKAAGAVWLQLARDARIENAWDNVAYFLGIASHYWGDVTCYAHHDNARTWYEETYGKEYGYAIWDALHGHYEGQVKAYSPCHWPYRRPALVVTAGGAYDNLDTFLVDADEFLDNWIYNVIPPGSTPDNPMGGWWWQWIKSRKCEDSGVQAGLLPKSGSKESVDLATTLIYSGWVYALGIQDSVAASGRATVTFEGLTDQYF